MQNASYYKKAIAACENALNIYTQKDFPVDWARTQSNLAATYSKRIKGERAQNLEQAIASYQNALSIRTQKDFPVDWATTQNNLGIAYQNRIKGDRAQNLELAIAAYENALIIQTQKDLPVDWAGTQNNLGTAYSDRIKGDRAQNQEQAIASYKKALIIYTQQDFPVDWARTQNNLGTAYKDRIKGDWAQNQEQAIASYKKALIIYTQRDFPVDWAMTQSNLGIAYSDRIKGERAQNLEQAIASYQKALIIYTQQDFPVDWARTQSNLGTAYIQRIKGDRAQNLEQAIAACENALNIYTKKDFPVDWARTQSNLAATYSKRIKGERAQNLEQAIASYQNALSIRTQKDFPVDWAETQNNLGAAYKDRIKGERAQNLEKAIASYQNALTIYTQKAFPVECLQIAANLGNLYFEQGHWELAIQTYQEAIAAIEITRNWAINDLRREEILANSMAVYRKMVQACINNGQVDLAIETTERSRARHLVDLMASNDLYQGGDIPKQVQAYLQQYEHLQKRINLLRSSSQASDDRELATSRTRRRNQELSAEIAEINKLEAEKHDIWLQLRGLDPVLAGQQQVDPISFDRIKQLIDNESTAILCVYSTKQDTYIFILYRDRAPQVHTCKEQNMDTLYNEFLLDNWLRPYRQDFGKWRENMPKVLQKLAQRLQLDQLLEKYLQGIEELIIIPHLWLHQIPFAALPVNSSLQKKNPSETNSLSLAFPLEKEIYSRGMGGKSRTRNNLLSIPEDRQYLGDLFRLRILPSCQILNYCHQRPNLTQQKTMGLVEDASEDLPYTTYECETIASKYNINPSQRLQRHQATVNGYRQLASQVSILHSSHHGSANPSNPLESALILSDANLTLGELLTPGWRRDLQNLNDVYLNNCETNFSVNKITDDLLSMGTGFLCAGARSVVSTLWSVDDCASALLAIFYYDFRNSGSSRPQALQKAQQKLRTLTGKQLQDEYYEELKLHLQQQRQKVLANAKANQNRQQSKEYKSTADKIQRQIERTLPKYCRSSHPFASPYYWAGFISQGLA